MNLKDYCVAVIPELKVVGFAQMTTSAQFSEGLHN